MKKSIRRVLLVALALTLVCGLAVTGFAATIGNGALYHEYILVDHYLTLLEQRASASVTIEDTYGGIEMSSTGKLSLEFKYYSSSNQYYIVDTIETTRIYTTGSSLLKQISGNDRMKYATVSTDIRLNICGTSYRFHPNDLHLTDANY